MKKLLLKTAIVLGSLSLMASIASAYTLPASYRAVYCYPGGTYWQAQISRFGDYYAANNAYYIAHYGAATRYCPV